MLLCSAHHDVIDSDPEAYTVERLLRMKDAHENSHAGDRQELSDDLAHTLVNASLALHDNSFIVAHQSGGQVAQAITNVFTPSYGPDQKARQGEHDLRVFREGDAILNEDLADDLFGDLLSDHSYRSHHSTSVDRFARYLEKVSNEFLDEELEELSNQVVHSLDELLNFLMLKFWSWPEDQSRENVRFCMYPWGNMDRAWRGDAESMTQYDRLTDELREYVNKASASLVAYRRHVKRTLFV